MMPEPIQPSMAFEPCDEDTPTPPFRLISETEITTLHPCLVFTLGLPAKILRGAIWIEDLYREGASNETIQVWEYLDWFAHGLGPDGQPCRCAWPSIREIARETGVPISNVRRKCLPWLIEHRWIEPQVLIIDGKKEQAWWCLWLTPIDLAGGKFDLGNGVMTRLDPPQDSCRRRAQLEPPVVQRRTLPTPQVVQRRAPRPAPIRIAREIQFNSIPEIKKTTDDRPREPGPPLESSSSSLSAAPLGGGNPEGSPQTTPIEPAPPALDPRIEAKLAELPEADRPKAEPQIRAKVATLQALPVERIMEAMRRLILATARKSIGDYGQFLEGILAKMQRDDELGRSKPTPKTPEQIQAERQAIAQAEADKRRVQAEAARMQAEKERDLKARWEALPQSRRDQIKARVIAENPGVHRWANMLEANCLALLEAES